MPFYVYVLRCADGTYYTGHTDEPDQRMAQHARGEGSKYTSKRRPLELIWIADFQTRNEAFELERRLHGWSRAKKEALMRGDFEALPALSMNKVAREAHALALRQAQGERLGDGGDAHAIALRQAQGERNGDVAARRRNVRADQLLVERGLAESRSRAQALIMAGLVMSGERKIAKAGELLAEDAAIEVRGKDHPWVSRGGLKLDHGLTHFGFDIAGAVALDVGSSTGGFTDVLLSRGATRVYAVDVGTNQLAWKLRQDPRVIVLEQTNARHLTAEIVPEPVDIIVCDASFISLSKVLEAALDLAKAGARLVALVKPQFEAGRSEVGKGGVVRDPAVHQRVCDEARAWVESRGWRVIGVTESPITGPEGNKEFLLGAINDG